LIHGGAELWALMRVLARTPRHVIATASAEDEAPSTHRASRIINYRGEFEKVLGEKVDGLDLIGGDTRGGRSSS
jgi:hypothetical protein